MICVCVWKERTMFVPVHTSHTGERQTRHYARVQTHNMKTRRRLISQEFIFEKKLIFEAVAYETVQSFVYYRTTHPTPTPLRPHTHTLPLFSLTRPSSYPSCGACPIRSTTSYSSCSGCMPLSPHLPFMLLVHAPFVL